MGLGEVGPRASGSHGYDPLGLTPNRIYFGDGTGEYCAVLHATGFADQAPPSIPSNEVCATVKQQHVGGTADAGTPVTPFDGGIPLSSNMSSGCGAAGRGPVAPLATLFAAAAVVLGAEAWRRLVRRGS